MPQEINSKGFCYTAKLSEVPDVTVDLPDSFYRLWIVDHQGGLSSIGLPSGTLDKSFYFCPPRHQPTVEYSQLVGYVCWFDRAFVDHNLHLTKFSNLLAKWKNPMPTIRQASTYFEACRLACFIDVDLVGLDSFSNSALTATYLQKTLILNYWCEVLGSTTPWLAPVSRSASIIQQFLDLVDDNFTSEQSPAQYARRLFVSESSLQKTCKAELNLSPKQVIQMRLIKSAQRQLIETTDPVNKIGERLGYRSHTYFSEQFKQYQQMSPLAYRKLHQS